MKSALGVQPSLVKEYVYCPVIPWIISRYGVVEPMTDSMRLGREEHDETRQLRVRSRHGVAVIDELVEEEGGYVIVEKKAFRSRSIHRYVLQVVTQYMIASEKIRGIRKLVLVNGDRRHELEVTDNLVEETRLFIEKLLRTLESDRPPQPTTDKWKCRMCWYRRFCPYS